MPDTEFYDLRLAATKVDRHHTEYSLVAHPANPRKKKLTIATLWRNDGDTEQAIMDLFRKAAGYLWSSDKRTGVPK